MSVLGLVYACPTCPGTHAFGFSRLTLWLLALGLSLCLLLTRSRLARLQAIVLAFLLLPMAWFLMHQAVHGWCPTCVAWWACMLGALIARLSTLQGVERVSVGAAALVVVGGTAWSANDPAARMLAAQMISRQERRIESFRARFTPPPGLKPGEQIPAGLRPYDGRIVLAVPDCPPCVADSVNRFVAQLPAGAQPVVLVSQGLLDDPKDEAFAEFAVEVDAATFAAMKMLPSAPPYVFRFAGGTVNYSAPLSSAGELQQQFAPERANDLGADPVQVSEAQKQSNKEDRK